MGSLQGTRSNGTREPGPTFLPDLAAARGGSLPTECGQHKVKHRRHPVSSEDVHHVLLGWRFGLERNFSLPLKTNETAVCHSVLRDECLNLR